MYSDPNSMVHALFAKPSASGMDYIQRNLQAYVQSVPAHLQHISQAVQQSWETFRDHQFSRKAEALRNKLNTFWKADSIHYHETIGEIQQARPTMARWIMAHPETRELYHDGRIQGYGDRYIDNDPGISGSAHYDYRLAVDGLVLPCKQTSNEEEETTAQLTNYTNYYEEIDSVDTLLSHLEKAAIHRTWAVMDEELESGDADYTSEWNDTRG